MIDPVIIADFVSALFLTIIAVGMFLHRDRALPERLFTLSVFLAIFTTVADAVSYFPAVIDHPSSVISVIINIIAFSGCDLILPAFVYYAWAFINEKHPTSLWYPRIAAIGSGLDFLLILIGTILGQTYTVENGMYAPGVLSPYVGVIQLLSMLILFLLLLPQHVYIGWKAVASIGIYFILPALTGWISSLFSFNSFIYVAVAVVLLIVYISLQIGEIEKSRLREKLMLEVARTDTLTGLNNRRAYQNDIPLLSADATIGVVFCDLNRLKYTNDNYGHTAGDGLLLQFAALLRKCFPEKDVYRISGDEFVVLMRDVTVAEFQTAKTAFRECVTRADGIASLGFAHGAGKDALELVRDAEQNMYREKTDFYLSRGLDRRK